MIHVLKTVYLSIIALLFAGGTTMAFTGDDFYSDCLEKRPLLFETPQVKNAEPATKPLVVVTDLLGEEHYSKIEIVDESPYLWAIAHSDRLKPGVYLITSTSRKNLFKTTLVVQAN